MNITNQAALILPFSCSHPQPGVSMESEERGKMGRSYHKQSHNSNREIQYNRHKHAVASVPAHSGLGLGSLWFQSFGFYCLLS